MVRLTLLCAVVLLAATLPAADTPAPNQQPTHATLTQVESAALDGLTFKLTVSPGKVGKGKGGGVLPPSAAGASLEGWVLGFVGNRAVITIPKAGEAKCKFKATSDSVTVTVRSAGGGNLPDAQALAGATTVGSVALAITCKITDAGKTVAGTITWVESSGKKKHAATFAFTGVQPTSL